MIWNHTRTNEHKHAFNWCYIYRTMTKWNDEKNETEEEATENASKTQAARPGTDTVTSQRRKVFYLSDFIIGIKPANKIVNCANIAVLALSFLATLLSKIEVCMRVSIMIGNWLNRLPIKKFTVRRRAGHFISSKAVSLFEMIRFESIIRNAC